MCVCSIEQQSTADVHIHTYNCQVVGTEVGRTAGRWAGGAALSSAAELSWCCPSPPTPPPPLQTHHPTRLVIQFRTYLRVKARHVTSDVRIEYVFEYTPCIRVFEPFLKLNTFEMNTFNEIRQNQNKNSVSLRQIFNGTVVPYSLSIQTLNPF